jgi:hypothetical protein
VRCGDRPAKAKLAEVYESESNKVEVDLNLHHPMGQTCALDGVTLSRPLVPAAGRECAIRRAE